MNKVLAMCLEKWLKSWGIKKTKIWCENQEKECFEILGMIAVELNSQSYISPALTALFISWQEVADA